MAFCPLAGPGEFRETLAWPLGSRLAESGCHQGKPAHGYWSASYRARHSVCGFALVVFTEQGLDLGGLARGCGPLFCKDSHATLTAPLLKRTTHVSKCCPLASFGEDLYQSRYCGPKTGCLGLESWS